MIKDERVPLLNFDNVKLIKLLDEIKSSRVSLKSDFEKLKNECLINMDLTFQLKNAKVKVDDINNKISYIRNFIKDNVNSKTILKEITTISSDISKTFSETNTIVLDKINIAKTNIQTEIKQKFENNSNLNNNDKLSLLKNKNIDYDRLKQRQDDLENIARITQQLVELSKDMRTEAGKQGLTIQSIEDNIAIAVDKTSQANDELNKKVQAKVPLLRPIGGYVG